MALIQDQLGSLGYADVEVRVMRGNSVVLTFFCTEDRDSMFSGGKFSWLKDWFLESHKWDKFTIKPAHSRLVWLNFYGIPIHLWCATNINKLGQIWGEVITEAEETFKCLSFVVGKVLISTSKMELINEVMDIECRNEVFKIRVIEEQMVIHTFLKADCTCKGCNVQEPITSSQAKVNEDDDGREDEMKKGDALKKMEDRLSNWEVVPDSVENSLNDNNNLVGNSVVNRMGSDKECNEEVVADSLESKDEVVFTQKRMRW